MGYLPPCIRPSHLFLGTHADNIADMIAKGRGRSQKKTHCPQGHPYDEENTGHWNNQRCCRACGRERDRERRSNLKITAICSATFVTILDNGGSMSHNRVWKHLNNLIAYPYSLNEQVER